MTVKKFKRVIPGQLEKLKKLLDNCVIESIKSSWGVFTNNKDENDFIGNSTDMDRYKFFTFIIITVGELKLKFMFKRINTNSYELFSMYVASKNDHDDQRMLFDSIVPFYEKITYIEGIINHIDQDSICYIEDFFKNRIDFSYETICAYVEYSYGSYDGPPDYLNVNYGPHAFSEAEKQTIIKLSDVKNTIES